MINWIPVLDRTEPQANYDYLVWLEKGNISCFASASYTEDKRWLSIEKEIDLTPYVTHWSNVAQP